MKPTRTVLLVADAGRARAFLALGQAVTEIESFAMEEVVPPSRALGDDRPGRTSESVGPTRHAYVATSDPHREVKRSFAGEVAQRLARTADDHNAERIVVIAPPVMLGDLRAAYPAGVKDRLVREIDKDLTKLPARELAERLRESVEGGV
jgi:protein required for attachment to host cells